MTIKQIAITIGLIAATLTGSATIINFGLGALDSRYARSVIGSNYDALLVRVELLESRHQQALEEIRIGDLKAELTAAMLHYSEEARELTGRVFMYRGMAEAGGLSEVQQGRLAQSEEDLAETQRKFNESKARHDAL